MKKNSTGMIVVLIAALMVAGMLFATPASGLSTIMPFLLPVILVATLGRVIQARNQRDQQQSQWLPPNARPPAQQMPPSQQLGQVPPAGSATSSPAPSVSPGYPAPGAGVSGYPAPGAGVSGYPPPGAGVSGYPPPGAGVSGYPPPATGAPGYPPPAADAAMSAGTPEPGPAEPAQSAPAPAADPEDPVSALPADLVERLRQLRVDGRTIEAVELLRAETGMELYEASRIVISLS